MSYLEVALHGISLHALTLASCPPRNRTSGSEQSFFIISQRLEHTESARHYRKSQVATFYWDTTYPRGKFGPVSRNPVEEVMHWDRWGQHG